MRQTPEEIKTEADIKVARWLVKNYEYRTAQATREQQKTSEILKIQEIEEDIRKQKKGYYLLAKLELIKNKK